VAHEIGDIELRRADARDSSQVAELFRLTRTESLPHLPVLHTPEEDRSFFEERVFRDCDVWVAEREGLIVGFCAFRDGWIDHLYVHPAHHDQGLGSALLGKAMETYPALKLWVFQQNVRARRFYDARGFALVETTDGQNNEEREPDALYSWSSDASKTRGDGRLNPGKLLAGGVRLACTGAALAACAYAVYVAKTWAEYGAANKRRAGEAHDALVDGYMPDYEVAEHHEVLVWAPADYTFEAARELDIMRSKVVRRLFSAREWLMRSTPAGGERTSALVRLLLSVGWGILEEVPGRAIVLGTVTKPWEANVLFRSVAASEFASFHEPGYAKIVWAIGVRSLGPAACIAWTETRVTTTDAESRARFRLYWSLLSPGILLIRPLTLRLLKEDAERKV
jgi:putative acetyltransferase